MTSSCPCETVTVNFMSLVSLAFMQPRKDFTYAIARSFDPKRDFTMETVRGICLDVLS